MKLYPVRTRGEPNLRMGNETCVRQRQENWKHCLYLNRTYNHQKVVLYRFNEWKRWERGTDWLTVLFLMSSKALTAIRTLSSSSSRPPSMAILVGGVEKVQTLHFTIKALGAQQTCEIPNTTTKQIRVNKTRKLCPLGIIDLILAYFNDSLNNLNLQWFFIGLRGTVGLWLLWPKNEGKKNRYTPFFEVWKFERLNFRA